VGTTDLARVVMIDLAAASIDPMAAALVI